MSSFGFDPQTVFGNGKKKNGVGAGVFGKRNGISTFRTEEPKIDVFGIGEDFGERIGRRAGMANGKEGGFLGIIGTQQARIPSIIGREPTPAGARRAKKARKGKPKRVSSGFFGLEETLFGTERRVSKTVGTDVKVGKKIIKKKVARFKARREAKKTKQKVAEFTRRNG